MVIFVSAFPPIREPNCSVPTGSRLSGFVNHCLISNTTIGGTPLTVTIASGEIKEMPQMTANDLNQLQADMDASNSVMKFIRKVSY